MRRLGEKIWEEQGDEKTGRREKNEKIARERERERERILF